MAAAVAPVSFPTGLVLSSFPLFSVLHHVNESLSGVLQSKILLALHLKDKHITVAF